jgi:endonuclease/exonuclease/phosphatase family metal-dependent hydrolase
MWDKTVPVEPVGTACAARVTCQKREMRRLLAALVVVCCAAPAHAQRLPHGRFRAVTYNVAGLPESISGLKPVQHLPQISAVLNRYDLAFVQEDFAYPELLRSRLRLAHQSPAFARGQAIHFGDGLSDFSRFAFGDLRRMAWRQCHGVVDSYFDCLTPKGLAMTRVELAPGILVDAYNVHLDAGAGTGDVTARAAQLAQLFETIAAWSKDAPVLLAGDFNLTAAEVDDLRALAARAGLRDACDALRCGQSRRLDRVLFRSSESLELRARSWRTETSLRDEAGQPLSDHLAVVVGFDWAARKPEKVSVASADNARRPDAR